jgi:hypothetical protein
LGNLQLGNSMDLMWATKPALCCVGCISYMEIVWWFLFGKNLKIEKSHRCNSVALHETNNFFEEALTYTLLFR